MAHHTSNPEGFGNGLNGDDLKKFIQDGTRSTSPILGPTGRYPEGQLSKHDEGEIQITIAEFQGKVVMNFGKPIASIGFTKEQAVQIGGLLQDKGGFSTMMWFVRMMTEWEKAHLQSGNSERVTAHSIINWVTEHLKSLKPQPPKNESNDEGK